MDVKWKFLDMVVRLALVATVWLCGVAVCAPTTRPLEHSPSDLAWDAWLQQQGSREAPALPPRRITTKSLFVFPNLGTESLPACAEGYRPDSMNRCVKVVKVDENAHMAFLLQKLNSQFATETSEAQEDVYDYEIDTESPEASGPFQFSIPLALPSKSEEYIPGDFVVINKKDPQPQKTVEKTPTSSPEVVPEYINDKNQFFLDGPSGVRESNIRENITNSSDSVSVLVSNSPNTGLTLLIPSNGKFDNVSETNTSDKNLIKELQDAKSSHEKNVNNVNVNNNSGIKISVEPLSTYIPEVSISPSNFAPSQIKDSEINEKEDHKTAHKHQNNSVHLTNEDKTQPMNKLDIPLIKNNKDTLIDQIEALKLDNPLRIHNKHHSSSNNATSKHKNPLNANTPANKINSSIDQNITKCSNCNNSDSVPITPNKTNKNTDIEEKIKLLSRLADISRNTELPNPNIASNVQKKVSHDLVRFPENVYSAESFEVDRGRFPPDLASAPTSVVQFPNENQRFSPQFDPHLGIYPPSPVIHQPFHQPSIESEYHSQENSKPQWSPYDWNMNSSPNGEHSLMDFWSRMPTIQRYPYHVRQSHDRHPLHYQSLYPNSRQGDRLNVRHTSVNHRQGRDHFFRKRQIYQDDSMNVKRNRHPHFREPEELSRILQAFNGR